MPGIRRRSATCSSKTRSSLTRMATSPRPAPRSRGCSSDSLRGFPRPYSIWRSLMPGRSATNSSSRRACDGSRPTKGGQQPRCDTRRCGRRRAIAGRSPPIVSSRTIRCRHRPRCLPRWTGSWANGSTRARRAQLRSVTSGARTATSSSVTTTCLSVSWQTREAPSESAGIPWRANSGRGHSTPMAGSAKANGWRPMTAGL